MNYNVFRGSKVRLRAKTLADISVNEIESPDYDSELERFARGRVPFPQSYDAQREDLEKDAKKENADENCRLVIETLDGVTVGGIGVHRANARDGAFTFWIRVNRGHWRKGYAREAIVLLLRFYFNERRYHKCDSGVFSFNDASIALHRSLGFVEEGRLRESLFANGKYHDIYQFGITAEEFNDRHAIKPEVEHEL